MVPLLLVVLDQAGRGIHLQGDERVDRLLLAAHLELVVLGQVQEDGVGVRGRVEHAPRLGVGDGEGFGHAVELRFYAGEALGDGYLFYWVVQLVS